MSPIKRYIILAFAFLLVANVLSCHLVDFQTPVFPSRCPPVSAEEQVSGEELENFLTTWSDYMAKGLNKDVPDKISLIGETVSSKLPWRVSFFLNRNCWDAERFYYVEQRVRSILHTLYLKEHTTQVAAVLQAQLDQEQNDAKKDAYRQMIDMQDKIAQIEGVSADELVLVQGRETKIENVLSGKEKYK